MSNLKRGKYLLSAAVMLVLTTVAPLNGNAAVEPKKMNSDDILINRPDIIKDDFLIFQPHYDIIKHH